MSFSSHNNVAQVKNDLFLFGENCTSFNCKLDFKFTSQKNIFFYFAFFKQTSIFQINSRK